MDRVPAHPQEQPEAGHQVLPVLPGQQHGEHTVLSRGLAPAVPGADPPDQPHGKAAAGGSPGAGPRSRPVR